MIYKYSKELMDKAYSMRKSGASNKAVAKALGVTPTEASRMYAYCMYRRNLDERYGDNPNHVYHLEIPGYLFDRLIANNISSVNTVKRIGIKGLKALDSMGGTSAELIFNATNSYLSKIKSGKFNKVSKADKGLIFDSNFKPSDLVVSGASGDETFDPTLTPTQRMVRRPRKVSYYKECEVNYIDPEIARDIISLYVTCQLGYSAIRHVIGLESDKQVEDVIRQHLLGRNSKPIVIKYKGEKHSFYGELPCPASKEISETSARIIRDLVESKYHTENDPYVRQMINTNRWWDDPVKKGGCRCPECGQKVRASAKFCNHCGATLQKYPIKIRALQLAMDPEAMKLGGDETLCN